IVDVTARSRVFSFMFMPVGPPAPFNIGLRGVGRIVVVIAPHASDFSTLRARVNRSRQTGAASTRCCGDKKR
ncbi:MAG: hypothetical protein O2905_04500, partial [Proteobacteria bacterium]|nr:hypothetical protein [Pseudomonadota bacterium]